MSQVPIGGLRPFHRRRLLGGALATAAGVAISLPRGSARAQSSSLADSRYGVTYDTGTEWWEGYLSRDVWSDAILAHEIDVIANELHASAITLFGSDLDRLTQATGLASDQGLEIWLQPRTIDGSMDETRAQLVEAATMLETVRASGATTTLNLGAELTFYMQGLLDGATYEERADSLAKAYDDKKLPDVVHKLDDFLADAVADVRKVYGGTVTYSAASWEWPYLDWSRFDYMGVDHYRDADNADRYVDDIEQMKTMGKPVVITEFGCGTFEGASDLGNAAGGIVDWSADPAQLDGDYVRSESEQADTLLELLDIFEKQELAGAFVNTFVEDSYTYSSDPVYDLDMGSLGIVKVLPSGSRGFDETDYWQPKEAFTALAERWAK